MCLIIHKPAGLELSDSDLEDYAAYNSDGFGVMCAQGGKLYTARTLDMGEGMAKLYDNFARGRECVLHWRQATHGTVTKGNTHPFKISPTLAVVHNGILSGVTQEGAESDTAAYVRTVLKPAYAGREDLLDRPDEILAVDTHIGQSNRMVFMRADGEVFIIGKSRGVVHNGMWYSNTYAWTNDYGYGYVRYWSAPNRKQTIEVTLSSDILRKKEEFLLDCEALSWGLTKDEHLAEVRSLINMYSEDCEDYATAQIVLWDAFNRNHGLTLSKYRRSM